MAFYNDRILINLRDRASKAYNDLLEKLKDFDPAKFNMRSGAPKSPELIEIEKYQDNTTAISWLLISPNPILGLELLKKDTYKNLDSAQQRNFLQEATSLFSKLVKAPSFLADNEKLLLKTFEWFIRAKNSWATLSILEKLHSRKFSKEIKEKIIAKIIEEDSKTDFIAEIRDSERRQVIIDEIIAKCKGKNPTATKAVEKLQTSKPKVSPPKNLPVVRPPANRPQEPSHRPQAKVSNPLASLIGISELHKPEPAPVSSGRNASLTPQAVGFELSVSPISRYKFVLQDEILPFPRDKLSLFDKKSQISIDKESNTKKSTCWIDLPNGTKLTVTVQHLGIRAYIDKNTQPNTTQRTSAYAIYVRTEVQGLFRNFILWQSENGADLRVDQMQASDTFPKKLN